MKAPRLEFLVALYIFCVLVAELMGVKTFALYSNGSFHLNASVGIFVIPVVYSIIDIVTEVYGAARARSIVRSGLVMIFLLLAFAVLATSLPPSTRYAASEKSYDLIFTSTARIAAASLTAFAVANFLDVAIFDKLKKRIGKGKLWFRNNATTFISQFVDTAVFISLAFYALDRGFGDNASFLWSLILPYWLLKCGMSVIETPFVYLGVKWLQHDLPKS